MAVVNVSERFEGRDGNPVGAIGSRFKNRRWIIQTDSVLDTESTIFSQTFGQLPRYLEAHPENLFFRCRDLTIVPVQSKYWWEANAAYTDEPVSKEERDRADYPDPTTRPARISKKTKRRQEYRERDRDGNALLNDAEDKFPAQPVYVSKSVFQIEKDVADWSVEWEKQLTNSLNTNACSITDGKKTISFPAETAMIEVLDVSELQEENGFEFYTISCSIACEEAATDWDLSLLNEGFQYLDGGVKKRIRIEDEKGNKIVPAEAQLLTSSGGILAVGGTPVFKTFKMIKKKSWEPLPFITES